MRRLLTFLFLPSVLFVAGAQEAASPAGTVPDRLPVFDGSLVRFVHASPNAGAVRLVVTNTTEGLDERHVVELGYMDTTAYREVLEGAYEIVVELGDQGGDAAVTTRLDAVPGGVYTVAVVGLVLDEPAGEGDAGGGLWAWIRDLFTPDRPELALRAMILDDVGGATFGPDMPAYRIVHAAPGTDTVDFVHVRDDGADVLASVSYLDASSFVGVPPDGGRLEVRAAGTTAAIDAVSGIEHAPGLIHTVFLVGTPIEEVPLGMTTATAGWAEVGPVAPGLVGTRGMTGLMTVSEIAALRELLVALGQRVEAAELRLDGLVDAPDGDGSAAEAQRELEEASGLLEQAHLLLDAAERRVR
ncbi:MAG: DUF4397 domain-containing protein [Trueperaceae bacterium]|nr:DUF4397 domain-containing protein [Trueperaceae bacterium]